MVVITVQVNLIDVPARVDVVAVRIEHDKDVNFGVLQRPNSLFVTIVPAVDVPLCGQPRQGRSEVLVAVMTAIDVDDFLGGAVGFGVH